MGRVEASGAVSRPSGTPRATRTDRLLVLIPDALSDLVSKGEVTERYYNPGNLFREVHIVMTNEDRPAVETLRPMAGEAELHLHNLPADASLFRQSLGWRPRLLRRWARDIVDLAADLRPALIRCHGVHLNAYLASEIRRVLGVPYIVSLHGNPDLDLRRHWKGPQGGWRSRLGLQASVSIERVAISNANCVVCVYRFIQPYARRMGARRIEVIYNVVNAGDILVKTNYSLSVPPRIIVPGRQWPRKDPRPVLKALASLPSVHCTLVGNGPLHEAVVRFAEQVGVAERCEFIRAIPNDRLCRSLRDYDILVSVNDYGGVSKVELEAALAGMPIVTNAHPLEDAPEILRDSCITVAGDAESYAEALTRLLGDASLRAELGKGVRHNAAEARPELMEDRYVALYRELLHQ